MSSSKIARAMKSVVELADEIDIWKGKATKAACATVTATRLRDEALRDACMAEYEAARLKDENRQLANELARMKTIGITPFARGSLDRDLRQGVTYLRVNSLDHNIAISECARVQSSVCFREAVARQVSRAYERKVYETVMDILA
jgi:hypothetical protein